MCVCACVRVCVYVRVFLMYIYLNGLCLLALRHDVDGRVAHRTLVRVSQLCFACLRVSRNFVRVLVRACVSAWVRACV
jgi:hypothetical protein